jgi:hypothetical protein
LLFGLAADDRAKRGPAVSLVELPQGRWDAPREQPETGHLGFLIASGMMTRELHLAKARSVELLSTGDLLRPWDEDAASFVDAAWYVQERMRLAVLNREAADEICRWPALTSVLIERGMRRSRSLAVHAAIENIRGLDDRLLTLSWHLAERWGRRTPDGILIPFQLTHQMLADLVGARRPSVSTALGELRQRGLLIRAPDGWLLRGEPPAPL